MPAELVFPPELLRRPFRILANGLAERIRFRDFLAKTATADNLLFGGRGFLEGYTALTVQLTYRSFQHNREIFTHKGRVRQSQIQRRPDSQTVQLFRNTVADAPDLFHRLQGEQFPRSGRITRGQGQYAPELFPFL